MSNKYLIAGLIVLELLFGLGLGLVFSELGIFDYFLEIENFNGGILAYALVNVLFFLGVFPTGVISAKKLKLPNRIPRAVFYSIMFWAIVSMISLILIIRSLLFIYLPLIGVIVGFNIGLNVKRSS